MGCCAMPTPAVDEEAGAHLGALVGGRVFNLARVLVYYQATCRLPSKATSFEFA
jgi:hypothetical protein